jgi:transposase
MRELPDLSQLGHNEKDDLIRLLWSMLQSQAKQIAALQAQVADLQSKRDKNSRNSSKPPSSDGLNKSAPKSLRVAGERPTGGQKGHPGSTLYKAAQPDKIVIHDVPDQCQACHRELTFKNPQ